MVRGGQAASSALHRLNASGVQICEERLSTCLVQVPGLLIMDTPGHAACQKLVTANCWLLDRQSIMTLTRQVFLTTDH